MSGKNNCPPTGSLRPVQPENAEIIEPEPNDEEITLPCFHVDDDTAEMLMMFFDLRSEYHGEGKGRPKGEAEAKVPRVGFMKNMTDDNPSENFLTKLRKSITGNTLIRKLFPGLSIVFALGGAGLFTDTEVYARQNSMTAGDESQSYGTPEISPIIGVFLFEDESYGNSLLFGVRPLINISPKYAVEGEMGISPSSLKYEIDYGNGYKRYKEDLMIYNYCVNFIYKYPLTQSIHSYGTAGIGGISFVPENADGNTDLYFNFGGGIKFRFGEKCAFRLDIRQYAPSVDLNLFSPRSGNIYFSPDSSPKAEVQKIIQLNLGITYFPGE
jgi:hypothetical protein